MASSSDSAKELSAATATFSTQVAAIGSALSAAQDLCKQ
jgi:hypothetical protein